MSGICGVRRFDGGEPELGPVLAKLERRGPDGTREWSDGSVALGHTLLATTPEALVEQLPLTDPTSGCTITADVRLDNRKDLFAALGLEGETRTIGDGELILRAYLKWGEDCPTHLLGDFAFAIWDRRKQQLFCARDHMGMRQFNYCQVKGKLFAFATEDTSVLAHPAVPKNLNENRIADLIEDLEGYDFTSTFFESIVRLAPGHCLTVNDAQCEARRYWQLRPPPPLRLGSDQAYADAFLAIFTEAVRCRLRNAGSIGSTLSGGLDSTSVVAVASQILASAGQPPLKTYSVVSASSETCPETTAILSALTIDGLDPTLIDPAAYDAMADDLLDALKNVRNPFEAHGTMLRGIYLTARNQGVNTVLDGGAGDVALTSTNRVAAALATGRFRSAMREIRGETRFWKVANPNRVTATMLLSGAWVAYVPKAIRRFVRRHRLSLRPHSVEPVFARRVHFIQRRLVSDKHVSIDVEGEANRRAQAISHPNLASGRERFDQLSATYAVECRDPFMDIRLIEFCLSLPPEQLQADGWHKLILRRGVEDLIPKDLVWRLGKEHLGWSTTLALLARWPAWRRSVIATDSPLHDHVSRGALKLIFTGRGVNTSASAIRLFALDRFLRRYRTNGRLSG